MTSVDRKPRLAIFRPREKLEESAQLAAAHGYEVLALPLIEPKAHDDPRFSEFLKMLEDGAVDAVVFTSSLGATFAFQAATRTRKREDFRDALKRTRVLAIGPATRKALEDFGVAAEVPPDFSSRGLVEHVARHPIAAKRVVLLRSRQGSRELPAGLRRLGLEVLDVAVYDVGPPENLGDARAFFDRVVRGEIEAFAFLSSLTVHNYLEMAATLGIEDEARAALARAVVAAIGAPTTKALEAEGIRVTVAPARATFEDLLDAMDPYVLNS